MKQQLLKIVNPILFLSFIVQFAGLATQKLWAGAPMWLYEVHEWNGYLIGALIVTHIVLNWSWIKGQMMGKKRAKK